MKLIKAYIRHRKTEEVYHALNQEGFFNIGLHQIYQSFLKIHTPRFFAIILGKYGRSVNKRSVGGG